MSQVSYGSITITDTTDINDVYMQYARALENANVDNEFVFNTANGEIGWQTTIPEWIYGFEIWCRVVKTKEGVVGIIPDTPYKNSELNQLQKKLRYMWTNLTGSYIASGREHENPPISFSENNQNTYGFNSKYTVDGLYLRYNSINLTSIENNGLKLYRPEITSGKITNSSLGISLNVENGLQLYDNNGSVNATLQNNGLILSKGGIIAGQPTSEINPFIYLSTNEYNMSIGGLSKDNWRLIVGDSFGVDNEGGLYAKNAQISGQIGNWVIENKNPNSYGGGIYTGNTFGSSGFILMTPGYTTNNPNIANSSGYQNWAITAGNQFGVTTDGTLYANNAHIVGEIIIGEDSNSNVPTTQAMNNGFQAVAEDRENINTRINETDSNLNELENALGSEEWISQHQKYIHTLDKDIQMNKKYYYLNDAVYEVTTDVEPDENKNYFQKQYYYNRIPYPIGNPSEKQYFEITDSTPVLTTDTTANMAKEYYILENGVYIRVKNFQNYKKTSDTVINPEKQYYILENDEYILVITPIASELSDYYEQITEYYELIDRTYDLTTDTSVIDNKDYYLQSYKYEWIQFPPGSIITDTYYEVEGVEYREVTGELQIFTLSEDEAIDNNKDYYQLIDEEYIKVDEPIFSNIGLYYELTTYNLPRIEDIDQYYELQIENTLSNFINSHLEIRNNSLWIKNNDNSAQMELSLKGLILYGPGPDPNQPVLTRIAEYGSSIKLGEIDAGNYISISPGDENEPNGKISFNFNDDEIAYMSSNRLTITKTNVLTQIDIGTLQPEGKGQWSWKIHEVDGQNNLYLKWLG